MVILILLEIDHIILEPLQWLQSFIDRLINLSELLEDFKEELSTLLGARAVLIL
jgi:hypothetical protein